MAEGGDYDDETQNLITHDDDDDDFHPNTYDDDAARHALNATQPFRPGQASTPYYHGEQVEMQNTWQ